MTKRKPGRIRLIAELSCIDEISKNKYEQNWQDGLPFMYCFWKILSHLFKWVFAGKGSKNGGRGAHHIGKVGWYAGAILNTEEIRPDLDDRPEPRKGGKRAVDAAVKSVFSILELAIPKKFKRKPTPKPDC